MKPFFALLAVWLPAAAPVVAQSSLTFTQLASLPDGGRYGMGYAATGTALFTISGGNPTASFNPQAYAYALGFDQWLPSPSNGAFAPRRFLNAVLLAPTSDSVLILNGAGPAGVSSALEIGSAATGLLLSTGPNPTPQVGAGAVAWNRRLYTFGGSDGATTYSSQLRSYNPTTGTWTTLAPMPEARQTAGAVVNGRIFAFGGYNGTVNSARVDVYDIATNQWQTRPPLPTTVSNQAVAVQGEWVWLVGDFTNQSYLAAYNTRTQELRTFTSNLPPRRNAAAAVVGSRLYVWGGNTAPSNASTLNDLWSADVGGLVTSTRGARSMQPLAAFPNPSASGRYTLRLPTGASVWQLTVHDARGQVVRRLTAANQQPTLDLTDLPAGLYVVRAEAPGQPVARGRLVRQ